MYRWALLFFIFSSLAAICVFAGISVVPAPTARLFFYIFLAAAVGTAVAGMLPRRKFRVGRLIVDIKE
ncbi:MAG: hypothetical protein RBR09_11825 [Desulfobulbaceae bacterium]|jgi:uncharacterized membrane protein YtjA (UPF0391 family)|nr:DUF1328 domain-containing protein [Desulfobulbaceae bacterium]MDY0351935.1 hypothetical protein [Desulfobulbaceae bacterium]